MPAITNKSVINQATPICQILRKRGENLAAEHVAVIIVRAILEELGDLDQLSNEVGAKEVRATLVALVKPFITASKNSQNVSFAVTNGLDGQPLMPKTEKTDKADTSEFV